jgi:hypothetical protein
VGAARAAAAGVGAARGARGAAVPGGPGCAREAAVLVGTAHAHALRPGAGMPCPLRVVVVACSALLLAFVAFTSAEACDGGGSDAELEASGARARRSQEAPEPGSSSARLRRVRELLCGAWELASGRIIWRALVQARAGTLRRKAAGAVTRTAGARVVPAQQQQCTY